MPTGRGYAIAESLLISIAMSRRRRLRDADRRQLRDRIDRHTSPMGIAPSQPVIKVVIHPQKH
jgi:hypothetical protein